MVDRDGDEKVTKVMQELSGLLDGIGHHLAVSSSA